jgi:hypothetical protein
MAVKAVPTPPESASVLGTGVEPVRPFGQKIGNHLRLPIPPPEHDFA